MQGKTYSQSPARIAGFTELLMATLTKLEILELIRETAKRHGGAAPGRKLFADETGIAEHEWSGKHWVRWSEALVEAGFPPNTMQSARPDVDLLEQLALLVRELGRFPVSAELKLKRRSDPSFPGRNTFAKFGRKDDLVRSLSEFAGELGYSDVQESCQRALPQSNSIEQPTSKADPINVGFVYLLKHGNRNEYKIGSTRNLLRREGEIRIDLPQPVAPIHVIETDDPTGIESYWHRRFSDRRLNGEWFKLSATDVRAFCRWKRII